MKLRRLFIVFAAVFLFSGCATTDRGGRGGSDPLEPMNRVVSVFNGVTDKYAIKPLAQGYKFVTPQVIQQFVGNFFGNLGDVWSGVNSLLQGKPKDAVTSATRFTVNTLFGFLGTVDIATDLGLPKRPEDFGQTLAVWGVKPGPYIVLPFLGPSSLRDAGSLIVDTRASPLTYIRDDPARYGLLGLRIIDTRAGFLAAERFMDSTSFDDYTFFRNGFFQRRYSLVWDGDPPDKAKPTYDDEADDVAPAKPKAQEVSLELMFTAVLSADDRPDESSPMD